MRAIDRHDLADAPDLADNAGRDARRDEPYGVIDRWAASLPLSEVQAILVRRSAGQPHLFRRGHVRRPTIPRPRNVPLGPTARRKTVQDARYRTQALRHARRRGGTGPQLGEHNAEVLGELGYSAEDIATLKAGGAI